MDDCDVSGRRRRAIYGGLLAGVGLLLGLGGGAAALILILGVDTIPAVWEPFPIGWDLMEATVGGLALGVGAGMMVASTIR